MAEEKEPTPVVVAHNTHRIQGKDGQIKNLASMLEGEGAALQAAIVVGKDTHRGMFPLEDTFLTEEQAMGILASRAPQGDPTIKRPTASTPVSSSGHVVKGQQVTISASNERATVTKPYVSMSPGGNPVHGVITARGVYRKINATKLVF